MSRSGGREVGFMLIVQDIFENKEVGENEMFLNVPEDEISFGKSIFKTYKTHKDEVIEKLGGGLKRNMTVEKVYSLDRAILFTAITEIDFMEQPKALAINEAVRLAKTYSRENASTFVNGVLGSLYKD